ncbi:hypothetical protein [Streptomyces sp. MP131-18]|uniref:hypothetical protein n=1 Tax=Streptomyces sp. MP131-18 TaxID=1857892 RepID=UPI00117DF6F7|nr:hypothetical protein [Streptomyces sp. MP131-18]
MIRSRATGRLRLRPVGGAVADAPSDATAYAHRDANFPFVVMGGDDEVVDRPRRPWPGCAPYAVAPASASRPVSGPSIPPGHGLAGTLVRPRALKTVNDPEGEFGVDLALTPSTNHL